MSAQQHQLRALASALGDRLKLADVFDLTYDDKRSIATACGYNSNLSLIDYRNRYERGGIAKRIVDAYPKAVWAGGAEVVENADPNTEETEFERSVSDLFERLNVWSVFMRAHILARLGHYGVILIGAPGPMDSELKSLPGQESVFYLRPFSELKARITEEDLDENSPRFGLPTKYSLSLGAPIAGSTSTTSYRTQSYSAEVHWTRIIHLVEGPLDSEILGEPALRVVWNRLDDLEKVTGGGAEAAWRRAVPPTHVKLDNEYEWDSTEESKVSEQVDELVHGLRRVIRTPAAVSIDELVSEIFPFGPNAKAIIEQISGATGIPIRILIGSERGELASSQDRGNFRDRVTEQRREFAFPSVSQFLDRLIQYGALPKPNTYKVVWPSREELTEKEKAEVVERYARANKLNRESGLPPIIKTGEIREIILSLDPNVDIVDKDLPDLDIISDDEDFDDEDRDSDDQVDASS